MAYMPNYRPNPLRFHGRNWPTNINSRGVHNFQRRDGSLYERQDYMRSNYGPYWYENPYFR